jgi:hypothetical protein
VLEIFVKYGFFFYSKPSMAYLKQKFHLWFSAVLFGFSGAVLLNHQLESAHYHISRASFS